MQTSGTAGVQTPGVHGGRQQEEVRLRKPMYGTHTSGGHIRGVHTSGMPGVQI